MSAIGQAPHDLAAVVPWSQPLVYAEAVADCDWPNRCGPRQWRGAIIEALAASLPPEGLVPFTQREPDGTTVAAPPGVLYRVHRGVGSLYFLGPAAAEMALTVHRYVREVSDPEGRPIPVRGWRIRTHHGEIRHLHHGWATYRFRAPMFPCDAVERRRPRDPRLGAAWASQAVSSALETFAERWGFRVAPGKPVFAHVLEYGVRPGLVWERPKRGPEARKVRTGFDGIFAANLLIPTGAGIGSRVSEGFGEVEMIGLVTNDLDDHGRPVKR